MDSEAALYNKRKGAGEEEVVEEGVNNAKRVKQIEQQTKEEPQQIEGIQVTEPQQQAQQQQELLPPELLEQVFTFLLPQTTVTLSLVNTQWHNVIRASDLIWKMNLQRKFNFHPVDITGARDSDNNEESGTIGGEEDNRGVNTTDETIIPPKNYYYNLFKDMCVVEDNWKQGTEEYPCSMSINPIKAIVQ